MAPKLPFAIAPKTFPTTRVGNEDIGALDLPKYGDLSVNERIFIKENTKHLPDVQKELVEAAKVVAQRQNYPLRDAYEALRTNDVDLLGDGLAELVHIGEVSSLVNEARSPIYATAILKFRVDSEWTLEDVGDAKQIHPDLVKAIAEFAMNEEARWETATTEVEPEELGNESKPLPEEKPKKNPTGKASSGESTDTGAEQTLALAV